MYIYSHVLYRIITETGKMEGENGNGKVIERVKIAKSRIF